MQKAVGLVVDDDAQVRRLLADALRRGGRQVLEARSGIEAWALAQAFAPDFVVTDIQMADVDGLELCRRLRRLYATSRVPIVVVSGSAASQGDEALAAGCDVVLAKPCSLALLLATIEGLLVTPPSAPGRTGR